jgi:small GTP-binding protein
LLFFPFALQNTFTKEVQFDGMKVQLTIIEANSQDFFDKELLMKLEQVDGFIVMYSLTNRASFNHAEQYRERILDLAKDKTLPTVLVENKYDLRSQREVQKGRVQELAAMWGNPCFEISAKERINVDELFSTIMENCLKDIWRKRINDLKRY